MSSLRSSSLSRSKIEHTSSTRVAEVSLSSRRPSWTPELGGDDHHVSYSPLAKRRARPSDENSPLSPEWTGSVPSLLKPRRPSFVPSLPEGHHRSRKPRVEPEASPEVSKASATGQPVSPEEGKSLRSSWEINVKDLVGDAVGNVCALRNLGVNVDEGVDEHQP